MGIPADEIEWWIAAVHEAAHAVCYWHYGHKIGPIRLFELEDGTVGGHVVALAGRYHPMTKAVTSLAGPIAEQKASGRPWDELIRTVCANDLEMAEEALGRLGDNWPGLASAIGMARIIVDERWPVILKLADGLVRVREMDYAAFETLFSAR